MNQNQNITIEIAELTNKLNVIYENNTEAARLRARVQMV